MRIRRILGVLLISFTVLAATSAVAAVKPGDACKTLGSTSVIKGIQYTCIKSGKKFVWNKGKVIPKPVPKVAASATPTPSIPAPSVPSATPSTTPTDTRTPEDIKNLAILEKSWRQIYEKPNLPDSNRVIFLIDPKFPSTSRDAIKLGVEATISKFDYLFKLRKPVYVIFSTSLEFELAQFQKYPLMQETYLAEVRSNPILLQWRKDHYTQIDSGVKDFASGGTMPLYNGVLEPAGYYMYFRAHPENQDPTMILMGAHETSHLMHWQMNWDYPSTLPAWWLEGQAQMMGESVASRAETFSQFVSYLKSQTSPNYGGGFFSGSTNLREMEGDSVTRTQFNCALCGTRLIYSRGGVGIHYLVGQYGLEKVTTFVASLNRNNLWWQAFEKTFGISVESFYADIDKYMQWYGDYFSPGWRTSKF